MSRCQCREINYESSIGSYSVCINFRKLSSDRCQYISSHVPCDRLLRRVVRDRLDSGFTRRLRIKRQYSRALPADRWQRVAPGIVRRSVFHASRRIHEGQKRAPRYAGCRGRVLRAEPFQSVRQICRRNGARRSDLQHRRGQ